MSFADGQATPIGSESEPQYGPQFSRDWQIRVLLGLE